IIELEYEGSEEELFQGDAMPSAASGWDVDHSTRKEGDEVKHTLTSTRRFEPGEELPNRGTTNRGTSYRCLDTLGVVV
ncbi:MAG: hypothetical protein WBE26_06810, partial [Phycisphaerae bacterium]